jgi:hypothetical protein
VVEHLPLEPQKGIGILLQPKRVVERHPLLPLKMVEKPPLLGFPLRKSHQMVEFEAAFWKM